MSAFVQTARIFLLGAAICCTSASADEIADTVSLAANAYLIELEAAAPQSAFTSEWENRAGPVLAPPSTNVAVRDEGPAAAEPPSIWRWAMTLMLDEMSAKWSEAQTRIAADKETLAACRSGTRACPKAAQRFLAIIEAGRQRQGRARLGEINRAVNLSLKPTSDMAQYGVEDYWASPLTAFGHGAGDCEDYAIAKYVALEEAGVAADDLRLEVVRDLDHQATHAVVAVYDGGEWLILDNRTLIMRNANHTSYYQPLIALDDEGARTYTVEVARRRGRDAHNVLAALHSERNTTLSSNLAMPSRSSKLD